MNDVTWLSPGFERVSWERSTRCAACAARCSLSCRRPAGNQKHCAVLRTLAAERVGYWSVQRAAGCSRINLAPIICRLGSLGNRAPHQDSRFGPPDPKRGAMSAPLRSQSQATQPANVRTSEFQRQQPGEPSGFGSISALSLVPHTCLAHYSTHTALRSRVARPGPRPEVRQTQLYEMFPMILFASSIVKPRRVSLRTLPREPALSRAVVTASSVPSTMLTAS